MNILVFSWRDPKHPQAGGAEQVMHEHAKGWIKAGHNIVHFGSIYKDAPSEEILDGVRIIRRGSYFLTVHLRAFMWYLFGSHPKFDVVIDEFHGIPFFTPLYIRAKKLAVLQEVAKEVWWLNPLPKPLNWIVGFVGYATEPLIFLLYKSVPFMVGSQSAKKDLISMGIGPGKITVVPHGVVLNTPKKMPAKEKKQTVVFLGALTKDKGIEDCIETFSLLNKRGREYNFWIMGGGEENYVKFLKKRVQKLGLEGKVSFFGRVSEEEKFKRLSRAHLLLNPSVREGWGLVNIEANSVGTPVVAYKSPGLVDSVNDGKSGLLCKINTPGNLADTTMQLLKDTNLYSRLQRGAVKWSKQFEWEKSKNKSLKLIEHIANET